ncbi:AAA family ATPase [Paracoccus sp. NGMCC 1.201697]|uniref:AAA family ATPase n=1 Tax=Paracoccus broussonetiae subsp. drimophilus TaxID=3373869 RepID=A0ABW7LHA3_9RHOB
MINKRIEKYAIYSKSFRGAPDGWHNIRACNFLVGENSTGKSSFLQLIEILDSREHLVLMDISGIVDGLDSPSDICSRISGSQEVTVGFLVKDTMSTKEPSEKRYYGRMATYKIKKGELVMDKLTILSGNRLLRMKRIRGDIPHRHELFFYDEGITHVLNAKNLEKIHFSSSRFKKTFDEDHDDEDGMAVWFEAMRAAISKNPIKRGMNFYVNLPPLNCLHYGPMRAKTRRLYHGGMTKFSSSGEHIAYVLRDSLDKHKALSDSIEKFGKESGLFDRISISSIKTKVKDKPFALQVEKGEVAFYVDELGYGVGQILPIISDIAFTAGNNGLSIQQPELHLHPRAQAALGDVFVEATNAGAALVVETHSDFIIDRFRMKFKGEDGQARAQIIYFDKSEEGKNTASEIELLRDGTMGEVPDGFRSFFLKESIEKLEALL